MSIRDKPFDTLRESDLQILVDNQVAERRSIEYKERLPGNSDSEKKEFLADISSFANGIGGNIIFGIKENSGLPIEVVGLEEGNSDAEILRLESIIRDGIQPRIPGLQTQSIPVKSTRSAIIMRIPRSWVLPHMLVFKLSRARLCRGHESHESVRGLVQEDLCSRR